MSKENQDYFVNFSWSAKDKTVIVETSSDKDIYPDDLIEILITHLVTMKKDYAPDLDLHKLIDSEEDTTIKRMTPH